MLDCLFLYNGVTSLHQSNLCTWRFMLMHRSLQSMSEGMVIWFLICFRLFHARLLERLSSRYQGRNGDRAIVCLRVRECLSLCVHSLLMVLQDLGMFGQRFWMPQIFMPSQQTSCLPFTHLEAIQSPWSALFFSLSASFFPLTDYLSSMFCLFLCVWPSSTDHTPETHLKSSSVKTAVVLIIQILCVCGL